MYTDDNPGSYSNIFDLAVFETVTNDDKQRVITAIKNLNAGTIPSTWNSQNADSSTLIDDADSQTNPESSHLLDGTLSES